VNGVNAKWEIVLPLPDGNLSQSPPNGHYPYFFDTAGYQFPNQTTTSWGIFQSGQLIPVPSIANNPGEAFPFSGDREAQLLWDVGQGNVGVFPFGCDNCNSRAKPGCTDQAILYPPANTVQMRTSICQVYRDKTYQWGGTVGITLTQFPYPAQTIADHDVNTDGVTNSADLGHMLAAWGECSSTPCVGDLNNDLVVDQSDLGILLAHFVD
jgi:hypothetical protein